MNFSETRCNFYLMQRFQVSGLAMKRGNVFFARHGLFWKVGSCRRFDKKPNENVNTGHPRPANKPVNAH